MKSSKCIAKAIAELQKLQATVEQIESDMKSQKSLEGVEATRFEERLDKAYEPIQERLEALVDKAYEKDFLELIGIYEDAEENLPCFEDYEAA